MGKLIWNGVESPIHERLKALFVRLTARQRSIISERFGIADGNPKSISYLAKQLSTDERAVKRSIKRALQRLKQLRSPQILSVLPLGGTKEP